MKRTNSFIRDFEAGAYIDEFFVSTVAAVLAIRLFLRLAGYPQLGGESIHLAHMLWGGLFMMAALVLTLSFVARSVHHLSAILGGIGFGTFIDETGKFVTRDHDYFFQPAVALIYLVLVLAYIGARTLRTRQPYTRTEYLVGALREMEAVVENDLDPDEQKRALIYLERSDPSNPLVLPLRNLLEQVSLVPLPRPALAWRAREFLRHLHHRAAALPTFNAAIVSFFVVERVVSLVAFLSVVVFGRPTVRSWLGTRFSQLVSHYLDPSVFALAEMGSILLSAILVALGVARIRRSRLGAYRMFERSVLVSIFLTQVFAFYRAEFRALLGLAFYILVLITLRYLMARETLQSLRPDGQDGPREPHPTSTAYSMQRRKTS